MTTPKKNLAGIAKKKPAAKKPAAKKPAARKTASKTTAKRKAPVKKVEPELTPEQLRDQKAKETIEQLLEDSPITTLEKKDELLELDETPEAGDTQSVEWLQEQVGLQATQIETLKRELAEARAGNPAPTENEDVLTLFNELQENYVKMGGNFRVYFPAFLNRMIMFFPYLAKHKKYQ